MLNKALVVALAATVLSACAGGGSSLPPTGAGRSFPAGYSTVALTTADRSTGGGCSVSTDGLLWYTLPTGTFPALDFTQANCTATATISSDRIPPVSSWAHPAGTTQAIFVATSLQEAYSMVGMQSIENLAAASSVPITWMVGNPQYLTDQAGAYAQFHAANRDDVQVEPNDVLFALGTLALPWFSPNVSIEGAGRERAIAAALARGQHAFWGITWNSDGTDGTADRGAPWGSYCADVTSYKRPSPVGDCTMLALEWTARDLTRSYLGSGGPGWTAEAAWSTDPDDVLLRAGFSPQGGAAYERAVIDAYAAAGVTQPIVVVSQQESSDEASGVDDPVLGAIYDEAHRTGMRAMTLSNAAIAAATFSARPRAVAFPFIPSGATTSYNGVGFTPATIDYHDNAAAMTFIAGHTLPSRVFEYSADPMSSFSQPLAQLQAQPQLERAVATGAGIALHFSSPLPLHYGVAIWADPAAMGADGPNITPAGHAGFVAAFDLPAGESDQLIPCACTSATFAYSI